MLHYTVLTWYKQVKTKCKEANIKADVMSQIKILVSGAEHVFKTTVCKSRYKLILAEFVFERRQKK